MSASEANPFVSRGGLKLRHALDAFGIDVAGFTCADLGASTGGFTDCLLQRGAARVYSVDTAYGEFAWKLRQDPRVVVMERSNALHVEIPCREDGRAAEVDLVVMDLGWTPQRLAAPAALRWIGSAGRVISLIKPHYELEPDERRAHLVKGVLPEDVAERITGRVVEHLPSLGVRVHAVVKSPIEGGSAKGAKRANAEWLALLTRA